MVICDGFVGNVLLKAGEGAVEFLFSTLKEELARLMPDLPGDAGPKIAGSLRRLKSRFEYEEFGGGPLLGIRRHVHHLPRQFRNAGDQERASGRRHDGRRSPRRLDRRATGWCAATWNRSGFGRGRICRRGAAGGFGRCLTGKHDLLENSTLIQNNSLPAEKGSEETVDLTTIIREVDGWPVDDRIHLIEAIWDRIVESGEDVDLTQAQKAELDRRLAELDVAPNEILQWDDITTHLRRPR